MFAGFLAFGGGMVPGAGIERALFAGLLTRLV